MKLSDEQEDFGPWVGVPRERQTWCAVKACGAEGKSHTCLYDGASHHHGCIHYDCPVAEATNHGLTFRDPGWGLLCESHYQVLKTAWESYKADARVRGGEG